MDQTTVPNHIAIIMDGNGRWATSRGLERTAGHRAGAASVKAVVRRCRELGVRYLTLFSFSTENWGRASNEVSLLMSLLKESLDSELKTLLEGDIRLRAIGDLDRLPLAVRTSLNQVMSRTADRTGMDLVIALSYGAREEIIAAAKSLAKSVANKEIAISDINHELFASRLWTNDIPDPDLLIRTSGEMRISNFLLWQIAYSEIVVRKEYWPDFDATLLDVSIEEFQSRERRYGLTSDQLKKVADS